MMGGYESRILRLGDYVLCLKCSEGRWICVDEGEEEVEEFATVEEVLKWYFGEDYVEHVEHNDAIVVKTRHGTIKLGGRI